MPSATSSKRSRRAAFQDDDDGDDGVTLVRASSSLKNTSQRKKARISHAGSSRKSAWTPPEQSTPGSDDDEDDVMQEPDAPPTPPPATQYEILRDAGFKHLEDTERDDQRATQRLKERPVLIGENHAALNAIIESITCFNFMCHVRLHCELGPLLNFIVGENGSGKSAILTAITLCLGGKASSTNRGASLKNFVKEGTENSSIVVKIKNQGDDAYRPDQYGDSITVERWFNKSGSSGFRLKSETGRVISSKKGDVDDVVEYFCLQVDNPLNVLSQDNARQFLNAATPTTKYKYFVQGTQLEQLDHDYQLLQEILDANESKLYEYEETIAYLKDKYEKAVKSRDAIGKSVEMRQEATVCRWRMAWSQVEEQETILQEKENAIFAALGEITRMEEVIARKSEALNSYDNKIREHQEALEEIRREEGQVRDQEQDARTKFGDARKLVEETHTQERDIHGQLHNASQKVKGYEAKIREEEQRLEAVNGGAAAEVQKELDDAKKAEQEIQQSIIAHDESLPSLRQAYADADRKVQESGELVTNKRKEMSAAESRLRTLSQNRSDPLAGYDPKVPQLLKLIENDKGFREKPIGPMASYIQLTKPQWSAILEKFIGNLSAFVVTCKSDQQRLQAHIDRLRIDKCPVIIASSTRIGDRLNEPDPEFDTILRALKFDNQVVRDQLIINNRIEQVLLIESRPEAERVMFDGQPPKNVAFCLSFHDGKRGHGLRLLSGGQDRISTEPINPDFHQKPRMKSDVETDIRYQQGALEHIRSEYQVLETERRTLQQAAQRCGQSVTQHKRESDRIEKQHRAAGVRVSDLERALDEFDGADGRLQGLKHELEEAKAQEHHYGNQYGELAVQKANMNSEIATLKQYLKEAKLASQEYRAKVTKAEDKIRRFEDARQIAVVEKNQAHENHDKARAGKELAEGSRDRQIETVANFTGEARVVCAERAYIPQGETIQMIERKYESLKEQLKKMQTDMGGSEEDINNRASQATQEYREAKKAHKNLTSLVDGLKSALMDRLARWRVFQRLISAHARTNFGYLLSERGFRGKLLLDHKNRKLEVQVEPDNTRKNASGRNTKTLSGGEKSFSSICLLLAIWDAMGSPLRCLDEFDVFMDNVNRAISTNMLITAVRRSVGKQFILITPNAIEGRANVEKDVKIIRLTDPRQRRLADP